MSYLQLAELDSHKTKRFSSPPALQLWGGMECTVNRVNDKYFDQLARSGHYQRLDDLEHFAALGIQALRYPVLWENYAQAQAAGNAADFWQRTTERLNRLRELGIQPIVGLVHHGSGPLHTNLLNPSFAEGLAYYAGQVAQRFPWITDYTPVNEPLTTARFSALYGHWYPHTRNNQSFGQALIQQCRATILAMQAICAVNPAARLIATDDLGKTFSTPGLTYQAEFENERRWLSFDLLSGRIDRQHPLHDFLVSIGIKIGQLDWFRQNSCLPDIFGFNYYLTSERFLDERVELYPASCQGGNARQNYADVEAVRVRAGGLSGLTQLLKEAWQRYSRPLAVTEIHNGCTREEQLRWFWQCWQAAQNLRQEGIDVQAVTAWALLGSFDWNSLVTSEQGYYEPGAFDLRSQRLRPTALAQLLKDLTAGQIPARFKAVLEEPGWWERPERHIWGFRVQDGGTVQPAKLTPQSGSTSQQNTATEKLTFRPSESSNRAKKPEPGKVILITGATGTLGQAFARICTARGLPFVLLSRRQLDISNERQVYEVLSYWQPWACINAAGYVRVDEAENEPEICWQANTIGPSLLAAACAQLDIQLLTFSSDLVFDGAKKAPYVESDELNPLNVYGCSKAAAEKAALQVCQTALVVRTSAFFGPWDSYNFVAQALQRLRQSQPLRTANNVYVSPTYIPDLVNSSLDLLLDGEKGIWHLTNEGEVSWAELARLSARLAGIRVNSLISCSGTELALAAPRPDYSVLKSERGQLLPALDNALSRYFHERIGV